MTLLIVLACIAVLLVLLIIMRVRLLFTFNDGRIGVYLKVLFLKFELYADKKSKVKKSDFKIKRFRRRRDKVLKKYRIKKVPQKTVENESKKKHSSPLTMIKSLKMMLWDALQLFGKYLKFDKFKIKVSVGGNDAAAIALNYGYVIQALQYLVTFLEYISNLYDAKNKSAEVNADFTSGKWNATVDIAVSMRVFQLIAVGLSALKGYLKHKNVKNNGAKGK